MRLEFLRSEQDGKSVFLTKSNRKAPMPVILALEVEGALKNGQTVSNTWWLHGKGLCWSDAMCLEKAYKEME